MSTNGAVASTRHTSRYLSPNTSAQQAGGPAMACLAPQPPRASEREDRTAHAAHAAPARGGAHPRELGGRTLLPPAAGLVGTVRAVEIARTAAARRAPTTSSAAASSSLPDRRLRNKFVTVGSGAARASEATVGSERAVGKAVGNLVSVAPSLGSEQVGNQRESGHGSAVAEDRNQA